ncbi:MAG: ParA family protein [Flammeovirgaceae bacterium]
MRAKVIAVVNQKGGTGKTTTTVNLGCALGKLGNKVLLIDFDSQASLTYYLGIQHMPKGSVADVVFGEKHLSEIIIERENVSIAPANLELADAELSLASYKNRAEVLKFAMRGVVRQYDYILIDCGPSLSILSVNAMNAASSIIIPLELEVLALQGLQLISQTLQRIRNAFNPELKVLGVLLLKVDLAKSITQEVYELLLNTCTYPIFQAHVEFDEKAIEAPSFGQSLISYAPNSVSTIGYLDLAMEVSEKALSS